MGYTMYYADKLLITKGQCNANCNFAFHYTNFLILLKKISRHVSSDVLAKT